MARTRFHSLLRERVEEEINKLKTDLVHGSASDISAYRFIVGIVQGMETSLKLCDDIEGEFDERSNSSSDG